MKALDSVFPGIYQHYRGCPTAQGERSHNDLQGREVKETNTWVSQKRS